jgi:hypothetical protein
VERGDFRDLLAMNGRFAQMWRLQQEEKLEAEKVGEGKLVSETI